MTTAEETFALACQHHGAGNLPLAAYLYRQVLQSMPDCAEALSCLGVVLAQQGHLHEAVGHFQQAIQLRPDFPEAHCDLANVLQALAKFDEALAHYELALRLRPTSAEAHNNFGVALAKLGRLDESVLHHREAVRLNPNYAGAIYNLANVLKQQGKVDEAISSFRLALQLQPAFADGWNNLGIALEQEEKLDEATQSYRRAIDCSPGYAEAHANVGAVLSKQGDTTAAIAYLQQALRLKPDFATAHLHLGSAFRQSGKLVEAASHYRKALDLVPDSIEGHTNLGIVLMDQGHLEEAAACHRKAMQVNPRCATAMINLGAVHERQGNREEAVEWYRRALEVDPAMASALGNLVAWMNFNPELDHEKVFAEHCRWGRLVTPATPPGAHHNERSPQRRLRIGYVSPDFRFHALTRYLEPVLAHHDPREVEVYCYAEAPLVDAVTTRLQRHASCWRWTAGVSDAQVAESVRADGIDILVDLAGHSRYNRLGVFALKPAPVQVTWLGYLNTTGLATIDYRITDEVLDPPDQPVLDTEELVRLPGGLCCFAAPEDAPDVNPLPALGNGYVTFGSLNRLAKMNDRVYDLWSQVLKSVPASRLLMFHSDLTASAQERVRCQFRERGIGPERLDLWLGSVAAGYLGVCREIDIVLDTFPCTGGVTTCESLWMGVPVLSLCGQRPMERNSTTFLTRVGLAEWAVHTPERFVLQAINLSRKLTNLADLRSEIRDKMQATVCDAARFTKELEAAFRKMWQLWASKP